MTLFPENPLDNIFGGQENHMTTTSTKFFLEFRTPLEIDHQFNMMLMPDLIQRYLLLQFSIRFEHLFFTGKLLEDNKIMMTKHTKKYRIFPRK